MSKGRFHFVAAVVLVFGACTTSATFAQEASGGIQVAQGVMDGAREKLKATFKNFQFEKMQESPVPGLIEIYAQGKIIYYAPAQDILVMGEMYSSNGISLTEQRINAFAGEKAAEIDRTVALVLGSGSREVIEFVDPDCGHCRAAYRWFSTEKRGDLKHLIYFMPLKGRAQAEARVLELLCSKPEEREAALGRVFNPSAPIDLQRSVRCKEGVAQLAAQAKVAQQIGVYATPFYLIDGKVTAGFNPETLSTLLGQPAAKISEVD